MQNAFGVPSSYAGYVSMSIAFMTIVSALISPRIIRRFHTKHIVIVSIMLTIIGLLGFSFSTSYAMLFLFVVPYGLGAGAVISPNIMALALNRARWNEGYRWAAPL